MWPPAVSTGPMQRAESCGWLRSVHFLWWVKTGNGLDFSTRCSLSSPFLGLNILRQISLLSGPFQLLKHSPGCSRTSDLMSSLELSVLPPSPSSPRLLQDGAEGGLLFIGPGQWQRVGVGSLHCGGFYCSDGTLLAPTPCLYHLSMTSALLPIRLSPLLCMTHVGDLVIGAGSAASW